MREPAPIRSATMDDHEELYRLLVVMLEEGHYQGSLSEKKGREFVGSIIQGGLVLVTFCENKMVGSLGILPEQTPWSEDWQLRDTWFYVHPDYRRGRVSYADSLLRAAKSAVVQMRAPDGSQIPAFFGVYEFRETTRLNNIIQMFSRVFGAPVGALFKVGD